MTARTWRVGDPEPADHPPVVDHDEVTWLWGDDGDGFERMAWNQQLITQQTAGYALGGRLGLDWNELLEEHAPLREATTSEAAALPVRFAATTPTVVDPWAQESIP